MRQVGPVLGISPDGRRVAYSENGSGQYNLIVQPFDGGSPTQLTDYRDSTVRGVVWTPDGERLLFLLDTQGDEFTQLRTVACDGGPIEILTDAPTVQHELGQVSPDGRWLTFSANDRDPEIKDLLVMDLGTREVRRVPGAGGHMLPQFWSRDSSMFIAVDWCSETDERLYVATVEGSARLVGATSEPPARCAAGPWLNGGVLVVTDAGREFAGLARMDVETGALEWIDTPDWDVERVALSADERILVWTVNVGGVSELHVRDLQTGQDLTPPAIPSGMVGAISLSADGRRLALRVLTATMPANIFAADLETGETRRLTTAAPRNTGFGIEPTLVSFPTFDGRQIPALLYRPDVDGCIGVALAIHGGPESQERPFYQMAGIYQYLLSQGVAVLAPNVRGSTGYGRTYQKLIYHDFGGDDLRDFEAAAQYLRSLSWVDPDRIGVFGGSYGGFAALSCLSRLPEYWACGVSRFGMSNLVTLAQSVPPTWRAMMSTWIGDPETEFDFLMARSPITYADDITAPLLVIQGANDPRVVKRESDQIVASLRSRGVDVQYDVFDDEGHGFTKASNEAKANSRTAEFLIEHLGQGARNP